MDRQLLLHRRENITMHVTQAEPYSALNRQSAFIRTLDDEMARHASSPPRAAALREQLREEQARLAALLQEPLVA